MKNINLIRISGLLTALTCILFVACNVDQTKDFNPELITFPEITFTGFSPTSGFPGTPITITGTNFGDEKLASTISFNGVPVDIETGVMSYSDTEIVVLVPESASSGPIDLTVWTNAASSSSNFQYFPGVVINNLSSDVGVAGDQISINGSNFGTDPTAISVLFNGSEANIVSITNTEIVVEIPEEGTNGVISITYDNGERETAGPVFVYLNPSLVFDDFLEASPEFGGSLDRSGTQPSGFWPSTQPINALGDREWGINGNNQSGRNWGFVLDNSGELTIGAARGFVYDISDDPSSGYSKPTTLTLEANINLGTFTNNDPPRPHRGILLGFVSQIDNSGNPHTNFRGVILTPDSNEIFLWDGATTNNNSFAGIERVPVTDFIPNYDRDADHNLKLTVDTTTGSLVSFELDGVPFTFTTSPNFSDANTRYMMIGGGSNGGGAQATAYDISLN